LNAILIGYIGLNPIIATLGTNALLFGAILGISGGTPRATAPLLRSIAGDRTLGIPNTIYFALIALLIVTLIVKKTVAGRRFEASGASKPAALVIGLNVKGHNGLSYIWAQLLYLVGGVLSPGSRVSPRLIWVTPTFCLRWRWWYWGARRFSEVVVSPWQPCLLRCSCGSSTNLSWPWVCPTR
jgi:predicted ABC-type sugar transport system permease subunit